MLPLRNIPYPGPARLRVAVTGGTSGLGLALVEGFAARGDAVAFVARDADRVRSVAARIAGSHGIVGDVANKDDIHAIALQIVGALGGLDVLVNNASSLGPVPLALLADTECEDLETALATNLLGPFRLTKALLGALAASARERRHAARAGRQHHQRRRRHALRRLGCVRREQGRAAAPEPDLGRGAGAARRGRPRRRSRRHGHAAARGGAARRRSGDAEAAARRGARDRRADWSRARQEPGGERVVKAATLAMQRPRDARLLVVDASGGIAHRPRRALAEVLVAGDLLVANDAATLPASLAGRHVASVRRSRCGSPAAARSSPTTCERSSPSSSARATSARRPRTSAAAAARARRRARARSAPRDRRPPARPSAPRRAALRRRCGRDLRGHRTPRPADPVRAPRRAARALGRVDADRRAAGRIRGAVGRLRPRLAAARSSGATRRRLRHPDPRRRPVLDRRRRARCAPAVRRAVPHSAGTVAAICAAQQRGGRVVALGTTVVRALEHAAAQPGGLEAGAGVADNRLGAATRLAVVDAIVSGTHEPGTSHHELLRAFVSATTLARVDAALEAAGYRTHEFGDSIYVECDKGCAAVAAEARARLVAGRSARAARTLLRVAADAQRGELRADDAGRHRERAPADQHHQRSDEAGRDPVLGVMSPKPTVVMVEIAQ